MFKNSTNQKLRVFAFDSTTNLPKTGDAANLTAYESKDYGVVTVLTDTSATEEDSTNAKGYYLFDLTQAETNADYLGFSCKSTTANIVLIACPDVCYTLPPLFTSFVYPPTVGTMTLTSTATTLTNPQTAGTMTLTTTATNLTNAPTVGDFTSTMKTSLGVSINAQTGGTLTLVNTTTALTNPQTTGTMTLTATTTSLTNPQTAGTMTLTSTATNLTNAPTSGDFTATMKTSLNAAAMTAGTMTLVGTTTNLTNNTPTAGTMTLTTTTTNLTNPQTAGTMTLVGTATNLTNAPTAGDFTATMKTSLGVSINSQTGGTLTLVNTTTSLTNPQTAGTMTLVGTTTNLTNNVPTAGTMTLTQALTGYTTPPTAVQNRQEMDSNSTQLQGIKAKTDHLPSSDIVHTLGKLWVLDGNGNPVAPASDSSAIKTVTDELALTLEANGSLYRFTTAALVNAPSGGGGGGLTGPSSVTLTFNDSSNNAVPLVEFTVVGSGTARADTNGVAAFGSQVGTFTVTSAATLNILFSNTQIIVAGTGGNFTITGTASIIVPPQNFDECAIEWTAYGDDGATPKSGVRYYYRYIAGPDGISLDGSDQLVTSVGTGSLNTRIVVIQSCTLLIRRGPRGVENKFTVPARPTAFLSDLDVLGNTFLVGPDA